MTAATADAAGLKAVQSGSATIADGASSVTASLTSVAMGSSFLVFSLRSDSPNPIDGQVSGQLTNATTVTFSRLGTLGAVTGWQGGVALWDVDDPVAGG